MIKDRWKQRWGLWNKTESLCVKLILNWIRFIALQWLYIAEQRNSSSSLSCSKLKVNSSLQWINLYPVDSTKKSLGFVNTYPLKSDLSIEFLKMRDLNRTSQWSLSVPRTLRVSDPPGFIEQLTWVDWFRAFCGCTFNACPFDRHSGEVWENCGLIVTM